MIAMIIEVCIIIYLTSLSSLLDIIMRFVSLAAITKFDDLFAGALYDEKMEDATGTILPIEYKNYMGRLYN